MNIIRQFSILTLSILPVIAFLGALLWRRRPKIRRVALSLGIVFSLALAYVVFQPRPISVTPAEAQTMLDAPTGQPVLLVVYSHY